MKQEENKMKKKEKKRGLLLKGGALILGVCALIYLKKENRALKRELYNLEGQVQNQNDLIRGYQRMVERDAFAKGKFDRQHGIKLNK